MKTDKSIEELINHYRDLFRKGVEEMPIDNLVVESCKIKKTGTEELDSIKSTTYNCTVKGVTYPIATFCNQELLEFAQCLLDQKGKILKRRERK